MNSLPKLDPKVGPHEGRGDLELIPADSVDVGALLDIFHRTRRHFFGPASMRSDEWVRYLSTHDVQLGVSALATVRGNPAGLSLLGVRGRRAWITRLGVLPEARRRGVATALVSHQLARCRELGVRTVYLDVIARNRPARRLFESHGFRGARRVGVFRRESGPALGRNPLPRVLPLDLAECFDRLNSRPSESVSWLNATETLARTGKLRGGHLGAAEGGDGWIIYCEHNGGIGPVVLGADEPATTARALVEWLAASRPGLSMTVENLALDDPCRTGLEAAGFSIALTRIEMKLELLDVNDRLRGTLRGSRPPR